VVEGRRACVGETFRLRWYIAEREESVKKA
jgi:hypothetical protein